GDDTEMDSTRDDGNNVFHSITFDLWDHLRFISLITQSNPTTTLYKALDKKTQVEVCVKISLSKKNEIPSEIKILEHIRRMGNHPNVQEIVSAFHKPDTYWVLVTKYIHSDEQY